MLFLILFSILTTSAYQGSRSYEECVKDNFSLENACANSKKLYDAGKYSCELQGKPFVNGKSC